LEGLGSHPEVFLAHEDTLGTLRRDRGATKTVNKKVLIWLLHYSNEQKLVKPLWHFCVQINKNLLTILLTCVQINPKNVKQSLQYSNQQVFVDFLLNWTLFSTSVCHYTDYQHESWYGGTISYTWQCFSYLRSWCCANILYYKTQLWKQKWTLSTSHVLFECYEIHMNLFLFSHLTFYQTTNHFNYTEVEKFSIYWRRLYLVKIYDYMIHLELYLLLIGVFFVILWAITKAIAFITRDYFYFSKDLNCYFRVLYVILR